jgi:hypothetical protein
VHLSETKHVCRRCLSDHDEEVGENGPEEAEEAEPGEAGTETAGPATESGTGNRGTSPAKSQNDLRAGKTASVC